MTTITIKVDMPKVFTPKVRREIFQATGEFAIKQLVKMAQKQIRSMDLRKAYTHSLDVAKFPAVLVVTTENAVVTLVTPPSGLDPNALELGSGPWDMKEKLLKGAKFKDIGFRHGSPNSSEGQAKGGGGYHFKQISTPKDEFQKLIKSARDAAVLPSGKPSSRAKPPEGPSKILPNFGPNRATKNVPAEFGGSYTHKVGIYKDMMKMEHTYESATQASYKTVRRISKKSDPSSWIHPGWKALKLFDMVAPEVKEYGNKKILHILKMALGG